MPRPKLTALALLAAAAPLCAQPAAPKNIIVFVADGCGANTHRAFELWRGEPMTYQADDWGRYSVSTYALRMRMRPNGPDPLIQDPRVVYDPARAWDTTPVSSVAAGRPHCFAGYRWLLSTAPDSANTASAIFTGVPTFVGAVDVDGEGNPTRAISEAAHDRGMAVGVVTSVPFDHATPACAAGAHVPVRERYHDIARQMLTAGVCDVIAGAGHPEYDDNAEPRAEPVYTFIAPEDWSALRAGTLAPTGRDPWTLVDDPDAIRELAEGDTPSPLLILARAAQTLQQMRSPCQLGMADPPGTHPRNQGVPTLAEMTLAALNGIDDDPDGFFLMVEGGAVDWGMHYNQLGRVIEEMTEFHDTIDAITHILDAGDRGMDWSNTIVIVTADHDHLLWGPDSDTIPFQPLTDNGPGQLPGYRWHSTTHSNQPVPLFVRGAGAERFAKLPTAPDTFTAPDGTRFERPPYFHQSEIGKVLLGMIDQQLTPADQSLGAETAQ